MTNLRKPTTGTVTDERQLLDVLVSTYEALKEIQGAAQQPTPASVAAAAGVSSIVVIRGATVTLPGSSVTFTADVYAVGVQV